MKNILIISLFLGFIGLNVAVAQVEQRPENGSYFMPISNTQSGVLQPFVERLEIVRPDINLNQIPSLLFTPSEQSLIAEAREGFLARPPTDFELRQAEDGNVPRGPRELALGGIIYTSSSDWSIWMNGQKITPQRLLPEMLDIKVRKKYIKLKWFDAYTNQIFPIKLKPHQRFNIDTRIFLPGDSSQEISTNN